MDRTSGTMMEAMIDQRAGQEPREPTPDSIVEAVSQYYNFTPEQLLGSDRSDGTLTGARAITFTLIHDLTPLGVREITSLAGRERRVDNLIDRVHRDAEDDPKLREHMSALAAAASGEPLQETIDTWPDLVAEHYGLSREEIATERKPRALEARQVMAHLMVHNTVLHKQEVARQTGYGVAKRVTNALATLAEKRRGDPDLDRRIEVLEAGALPEGQLTEDEIFSRVSSYYGVALEDIAGPGVADRFVRARSMALHLLVSELGYDYTEAGRTIGRENARAPIVRLEERLAQDPNLRRQRKEILDPETAEREPLAKRMLQTVCDFYGVDVEALSSGHTAFMFTRPRAVTAYILQRRLGLSSAEIVGVIGRNEQSVIHGAGRIESELEDNSLLAAEIEYLDRPKRIQPSLNDRLIRRVSEATGIEVKEIFSSHDPGPTHARYMAMALMAERGHMSPVEIARLFGLSSETSPYQAVKVMTYHADDPLLSQQMEYARQGVFSTRRGSFEFDPEAVPDSEAQAQDPDFLPDIDESLVHPEIREQVYSIVRRVATFYKIPAKEVVGRTNEFEVKRARRAAAYLCRKAKLPWTETAVCFDARGTNTLTEVANGAELDIEEHPFFAQEIKAIKSGEQRRDMVQVMLERASKFYGIDEAELISSDDKWAVRARLGFVSVVSEQDLTTYEGMGTLMDMPWKKVAGIALWAKKRLAKEARLRAEIDYLADPKGAPKPPGTGEIIESICASFGIHRDVLTAPLPLENIPDDLQSAKRAAAYIMAEEMSLPRKQIAKVLGDTPSQVNAFVNRTREEADSSPRRALEIDRLKPAGSVSMSMATRIVQHVTRQFELELDDLSTIGKATRIQKARKMAVSLLRQAEYSAEEVGVLLRMPASTVQELTNGTIVRLANGNAPH